MGARSLALAAAGVAALPACAVEHDVDLFVVLPTRCVDLGAARAAIDVTTADGEAFAIEAAPCTDELAQQVSGFATTVERLGPGYHRAAISVEDEAGAVLGTRSLPFPADEGLIVQLQRADLPGWPTATIEISIPECVAGGGVAELRLTATAAGEAVPAIDTVIACDGADPATVELGLPRGPATIVADAPCWRGASEILVAAGGGAIELALTRSCP